MTYLFLAVMCLLMAPAVAQYGDNNNNQDNGGLMQQFVPSWPEVINTCSIAGGSCEYYKECCPGTVCRRNNGILGNSSGNVCAPLQDFSQVDVAQPAFHIQTVAVTDADDLGHWILSIRFQASKKPPVLWARNWSGDTDAKMDYDAATGEGLASMRLEKDYHGSLLTHFGDFNSQAMTLHWKKPLQASSRDLNLSTILIHPSFDVSYGPDDKERSVRFEIDAHRGTWDMNLEYEYMNLLCAYVDLEDSTRASLQKPPGLYTVQTYNTPEGVITSDITFNVEAYPNFNGFLHDTINAYKITDSPVDYIQESFALWVHEDKNARAFPDDWAAIRCSMAMFQAGNHEEVEELRCLAGAERCQVECEAYGAHVNGIECFKEAGGERERAVVQDLGHNDVPFSAFGKLRAAADRPDLTTTRFVCRPTLEQGTSTVEVAIPFKVYAHPIRILSFVLTSSDAAVKTVACTAEGSGPLKVYMRSYRGTGKLDDAHLEEALEYDPGFNLEDTQAKRTVVATASLDATVDLSGIHCWAQGPADSDYKYFSD